jgi:hypothetical protein
MAHKTKSDAPEIKVGSVIEFINKGGTLVKIIVARVENKSWYAQNPVSNYQNRNSYGTLLEYSKLPGFKVIL